MCRNTRTLFSFEPPATELDIRDASLQFARKLSEFSVPSTPVNAAVRTPKQKTPHGAGLFTTGGSDDTTAQTYSASIGHRFGRFGDSKFRSSHCQPFKLLYLTKFSLQFGLGLPQVKLGLHVQPELCPIAKERSEAQRHLC